MATTRRGFLTGAAAGALGAAGIYELVDRLTASPARTAAQGLPPEQHLLESVSVVRDEGVAVMVPPLHHQVVTAKVRATDLRRAQRDSSGDDQSGRRVGKQRFNGRERSHARQL